MKLHGPKTDKEIDQLLDDLTSLSHQPAGQFSAEKTWRKLKQSPDFQQNKKPGYFFYGSVAACFILLLVGSWMFYANSTRTSYITHQTAANTQDITLPDGSRVTLNSYSSLTYPSKLTNKDNKRKVKLSGEGYFDVAHDPLHPFIVEASQLSIEVLGTKFNVMAYEKSDYIETILVEGVVSVSDSPDNTIILKPNQGIIYDKNNNILVKQDISESHMVNDISWKDGILLFSNLSLENIAEKLSRKFNIDISLQENIKENRLTAQFRHNESLEEILDLLQEAGDFSYTKKSNQIHIKTKN